MRYYLRCQNRAKENKKKEKAATCCMRRLQKVVTSIVFTIVSSLVIYVGNALFSMALRFCVNKMPHRRLHLTAYESQIHANIVDPTTISDRMDDIGGLSTVKEEIRSQVLLPLQYPHIFFSKTIRSLRPARGILLYGPPGTGKTMLARAIAAEAKVPFLSLTLASLENKYFGESSKLLGAVFTLARKLQPCVVFLDEIDGILRTRSELDQGCAYGLKTEFLTHMDGVSTSESDAVIFIGCTNCADKLDPAIQRRLARKYKIDLPTPSEVTDIFMLNLKGTTLLRSDVDAIVARMPKNKVSGSDVSEIVRSARASRMVEKCKASSFKALIDLPGTTPEEVERAVGLLSASDIEEAVLKRGLLVKEMEKKDEVEEPPPS